MKYHPAFHENQGTKWSEEDIEYLCKFERVDDLETLGMALGRTKATIAEKLYQLKKQGKYEHYRNLNKFW
jgi:hypothetical protein